MQLEQQIQAAILALLRMHGIFCWKSNTTGVYDPTREMFRTNHYKGVSDIIGVMKGGRLIAVEVKRPGGKSSFEQQTFIDSINENGGLAFVAHSVDEVQEKLKDVLTPNRPTGKRNTGSPER